MIIGGKLLLALVLGSTSSVSAAADIVDTIDNNNAVVEAKDADTSTLRKKKKKNRKLNSGGKSGKGHGSGSWSSSSGDMYWYKDGKPYSSGWVSCRLLIRLTPYRYFVHILCISCARIIHLTSLLLLFLYRYSHQAVEVGLKITTRLVMMDG